MLFNSPGANSACPKKGFYDVKRFLSEYSKQSLKETFSFFLSLRKKKKERKTGEGW